MFFLNILLNSRHIGTRLDKINNHIVKISEMEDYELRCKSKKILIVNSHNVRGVKNHKRLLRIVM